MKQGIGEWCIDNIVVPVSLILLGIAYYVRHLFRKVGM